MPVNTPQTEIKPYVSTIPLVQLPMNNTGGGGPAQPLQGNFGKKGTGTLAIGDAMLKGWVQGRKVKAERENAKAEASLGAMQAGEQAAWGTYQDSVAKNESPEQQKAKYDAYTGLYKSNTAKMGEFSKEDKKIRQKERKATGGKQPTKLQSFGEKLKAFWDEHPNLLPETAILAREYQMKKPGLEQDRQVQSLEMDTAKNQNQRSQLSLQNDQQAAQDKKTYSEGREVYGHLTQDQIDQSKKDPKWAQGYDAYKAAETRLTPMTSRGPQHLYEIPVQGGGSIQRYMTQDEADTIPGSKVYQKPTAESQTNLYYDAAAKAWGTTRDKLSLQQLEYVDASRAQSQAKARGEGSWSYRDANGVNHSGKVNERIPVPSGSSPLPEGTFSEGQGGGSASEGRQKVPTVNPNTFSSGGSRPRANTAYVNEKIDKAVGDKNSAFVKAQDDRERKLTTARKITDPTEQQTAVKQAWDDYNSAMKDAQRRYIGILRQFGQTIKPGDDPDAPAGAGGPAVPPPPVSGTRSGVSQGNQSAGGAQQSGGGVQITLPNGQTVDGAKRAYKQYSGDSQGNVYGSDDGKNFYDVKTGQPYQPQSQQAGGTQQQGSEKTPAVPPPPVSGTKPQPKSISQLRRELSEKKAGSDVHRYSGAEAIGDYYKAVGSGVSKAASTMYGLDKAVVQGVSGWLDTYLHGDPKERNDYEIEGSPQHISASEAQEFKDHGMAVREKYRVDGKEQYMTPEEAQKAKSDGKKVKLLQKINKPA